MQTVKEKWESSENYYVQAVKVLSADRFALFASSVLIVIVVCTALAPLLPIQNPDSVGYSVIHTPPTLAHVLGTDHLGRDVLSRIIWGGRISLLVALFSLLLAFAFGAPLGMISGYFGGKFDEVIMRLTDGWMVFPDILLGLIVLTFFGTGIPNLVIAIGLFFVPQFTRLIRGSFLSIREKEFVQAAKAAGDSSRYIIIHEILPNILAPIIVQSTLMFGYAILGEAAYSFLGLGIQPPTPDWGYSIAETLDYLAIYPWMTIFPGLAISLTVITVNILGDRLRDAFDPRLLK